jgi:glycosyltransferase involved in cell wall biosynthesis
MNLALVVHDFDPRVGHGRYCLELAQRLTPRHSVTIYANRFAVEPRPGWTFVRVPAWRRVSLASVFTFLAASEHRVRRGRHDVVHAQGLTCWRADVITAHVCNAARYQVAPPASLRAGIFPALVNPLEAAFYRQRHARQLIAISQRVAEEIREHYGWRRPLHVIHHGVDASRFRPALEAQERMACRQRYGLGESAWVWLFAGEAVKGLTEAIRQLPAFPEARLLAISRSEPGDYQALAKQLGVADRLKFWGPDNDIAQAYRAADVFVYPSSYDTFGMVVSEAMATGIPVVIGRRIGAAELIRHGENGLLIQPENGADLRSALERLRAEPNLAHRLGAAGRATARAQTWDACAVATEAVYAQALA